MSASGRRWILAALLGLYLAALAVIGFWPSPVDRPLAGFLNEILTALRGNCLLYTSDAADE